MGNDIEIRVRVTNQTGSGLTAVNSDLSTLRRRAREASDELSTLTTRSIAAAVALHRLAAGADDAADQLNELRSAANRMNSQLRTLTQRAGDASRQIDDLDNAALSASVQMDGLGDATRGTNDDLRNLRGNLGSLRVATDQASDSIGGSGGQGGGLAGSLLGVAGALGASLLPSLGALSPMLVGLGAVGGGAALAMDDLKKKAKQLKPAFEEWKKVAEKAVAPHTKDAVKDLKSAMDDLEPTIKVGAESFGRIAERAAEFANSPAFKGALAENAKMGSKWVEEFAGSVGTFTQSFLDFGTKSGPALDAWQKLLGGLLDTGLPGMFEGLEQGVDGSSRVLGEFADMLNGGLLPALGKISGSFAEAFGPLLGETLDLAGQGLQFFGTVFEGAMEAVEPLALIAADGLSAFNDILRIGSEVAGEFASEVGGALVEALLAATGVDTSEMAGGFTKLSDLVSENEAAIRAGFYNIAGGLTEMVATGISSLPGLYNAFRLMSEGVLMSIDGLVSGLATAFGDLPGIGDTFKDMNREFDAFAKDFRSNMQEAGKGIDSFVGEAVPRLNRAQLKLNISEAEANIASLKKKLEDPSLTRTRRAELKAEKRQAEAALASAKSQLAAFDRRSATSTIKANISPFRQGMGLVAGMKVGAKTGTVRANTSPFRSAIGAIAGSVVGSAYINVYNRYVDNKAAKPFRARGGPVPGYAGGGDVQDVRAIPDGGYIEGPGSGTSDSILAVLGSGAMARVSNTEYVVRASSVRKYGLGLLDALNEGRLRVAGFAKGGKVSKQAKAEAEARRGAVGDLTVSHFGRMAGYQRSEMRSGLASPDSLSALVNSLNQWRSTIAKATHGSTENKLLKQLDSTGKKLLAYEKQLTSATKSLEKAKDKLNDLRNAAAQLSESVKNNILSSANITKGPGDGGPITTKSVLAGLTQSRDEASAFTKALAELEKKGLSSALIQQIAEAGIDGGGLETASALLNASKSEIASMNKLQSQITSAATAAGKITADSVYGKAIAAQERLVKRYEASTKSIANKMDKLAAAMEKAIEKGFGMKAAGGIIGAASGGARGSWTMVGEHEPELVRLPFGSRVYSGPDTRRMQQQAWASMLNEPRRARAGRPAVPAAAAGGDRPIVLNVSLGGREFGQIWVDVGRKEVQTRGGLRATLGGD